MAQRCTFCDDIEDAPACRDRCPYSPNECHDFREYTAPDQTVLDIASAARTLCTRPDCFGPRFHGATLCADHLRQLLTPACPR